jgi:penicillin amidase
MTTSLQRAAFVCALGLACIHPCSAREKVTNTTAATAPSVTTTAAGLAQPVEILVDRWGVPHIYAKTLDDVFFAQGWQAARDRLWQMDLWRKRGLGEMAKDFGPAYVEGDRMARAVLYRGDLYREWLAYGSDSKRIAEAFVAGVNAYVAQTEAKPDLLPEEFRILGYRPARWQAADVVRIRHHGLTLNFTSEVDRAAAYCAGKKANDPALGRRIDWLRRELVPAIEPVVPEGFDVCGLPANELRTAYALATASPRFTKDMLKRAATDDAHQAVDTLYVVADADSSRSTGSNNWTIAPSKTTTGRPILANDPHRAHGAPSLRYISHLVTPDFDVIGAGEPFLPGISIGHNDAIAFGLTRFYMDQEDLVVETTDSARPDDVLYAGRYEAMTTVTETIEVKGESPRVVTNLYTRHGPVLYRESQRNRAYVLRAAWLEPGMAPYFGSTDYMRARNWDQFKAAMNRWGAPGENQVYADVRGNIGWIPGGLTPIRPNWDGLLPIPGDGRFEWAGYRDMDELPQAFNPANGYVITANENNIPPDHPAWKKSIGYEWSDAARAERLKSILASKQRFSLEDSERMQTDTTSSHALRMIPILKTVKTDDARVAKALAMLSSWDGNERRDRPEGAIFEVWFAKHLRPAVLKAALGDGAAIAAPGDSTRVLMLMERPDGQAVTLANRDALIVASLRAALDELAAKLGDDPAKWTWGALHHAVFEHPLRALFDDAQRARFDVGSWSIGGSSFTPMATTYRTTDFGLTAGASFRMVLDVGRWDASRAVNTPGQSGNPASPHYRDLAPLWADGKYFPLLYSRTAVVGATESRTLLVPAR